MYKVVITLLVVVVFWVVAFCIAFLNPKLDKMIIDNKKRYIMWYTGKEDNAVVRKYIILW